MGIDHPHPNCDQKPFGIYGILAQYGMNVEISQQGLSHHHHVTQSSHSINAIGPIGLSQGEETISRCHFNSCLLYDRI
jgi:hypothetical protein